jgi:hypothetical protein
MEFIGIIIYFIPTIIAMCRHTPNGLRVFVVNLLLGWTVLGWVIALMMACTSKVQYRI